MTKNPAGREELEEEIARLGRVEQELRESERKLRIVVDTARDSIFIKDLDQRYTFVNPAMARLLGCREADLLGKRPEDVFDPGEARLVQEVDRRALKGERVSEIRDLRIRDRLHSFHTIQSPVRDSGGRIVGISGIVRDITEQRQAEERLRVSETNYRSIFDAANDGIFVHDMETGRILDVNARTCEMFGSRPEEIRGVKIGDLSAGEPPYTQEKALQWIRRAAQGEPQLFEWRARDRQGRLFWLEVNLKRASIGGVERLLAIVRDITQRKQMEEALARVQSLESLGLLAAGIAHDFNNILTAVLSNVSMATTFGDLQEDIADMLREAEAAVLRAQGLTRQLLTFARGGAPVKKAFALPGLLREATQFALSGSNVRSEFSIPDGTWPVEADEGQIGQVFQNIVLNADQSMPEGGRIRVRAENVTFGDGVHPGLKPGRYVKVSVQDEGCGIAEGQLRRIFDPFFSTKEKGRGLGLAIAHSIVGRHGGHVEVDSEPGRGTTFRVVLPAAGDAVEAGAGGGERPVAGKGSILLIDDEAGVRKSGTEVLKRLGFQVESAADGEEGLALYQEAMRRARPFDAVIMDLTIPGAMGGREAAARLRRLDPQAKVIVSSGYSDHPVMSDFKAHGFDGVVPKPYAIGELARVIHEVLGAAGGRPGG